MSYRKPGSKSKCPYCGGMHEPGECPMLMMPPAVPAMPMGGMVGGMPMGSMPMGGMPMGGMPMGGMPMGGIPMGGMPMGGMPAGGMPAGCMPCPEVPGMEKMLAMMMEHGRLLHEIHHGVMQLLQICQAMQTGAAKG